MKKSITSLLLALGLVLGVAPNINEDINAKDVKHEAIEVKPNANDPGTGGLG